MSFCLLTITFPASATKERRALWRYPLSPCKRLLLRESSCFPLTNELRSFCVEFGSLHARRVTQPVQEKAGPGNNTVPGDHCLQCSNLSSTWATRSLKQGGPQFQGLGYRVRPTRGTSWNSVSKHKEKKKKKPRILLSNRALA